jgi:uncharacterized protein
MSQAPHLNDLIASRRALLGGLAGLPLLNLAGCATSRGQHAIAPLSFTSVPATNADTVSLPTGYGWRPLIAWGDALFDGMAPFNPDTITRAEQDKRFGTNNDMLALFAAEYAYPPPRDPDRMILCANNEFASVELMYPGVRDPRALTADQIQAMIAAVGVSVVEIARGGDGWRALTNPAPGQGRNRRITPFTPVHFTGPAARHPWIVAAAAVVNAHEPDPTGGAAGPDAVRCGTLANCAGGMTPWGTYLTAEENFDYAFFGSGRDLAAARADDAYALDADSFSYPRPAPFDPALAPAAFRLGENPHGPALYGWIVEIDPYDPASTPKKRTALGRKQNECAATALTRDGRVAVYMGDDQRNEHVYKFVTHGRFDPRARGANMDLLDEGQLYCARFEADGQGRWIAITAESANAAAEAQNSPIRFRDAGDVVMRVRDAARLLGATPMDRPEDIEAVCDDAWRGRGPVLIACTNNSERGFERPGNPRRAGEHADAQANHAGHVLRIDEADGDCGAEHFRWDVFAMGGDPDAQTPTIQTRSGASAYVSNQFAGRPTTSGDRFACPDNLFIDRDQRVWIATDGNDGVFADCNDCVMVTPLHAEGPRPIKRFLVGPVGAEICGPIMAPDERAFFCAIQHPGENDIAGHNFRQTRWAGAAAPSAFPDGGWPRSAVIVITRRDGGRIGG